MRHKINGRKQAPSILQFRANQTCACKSHPLMWCVGGKYYKCMYNMLRSYQWPGVKEGNNDVNDGHGQCSLLTIDHHMIVRVIERS